jgi:hypothetical protein
MEGPAATLRVNEMTVVVLLVRPQSRDPAGLAMPSPEPQIDPVVGIERRDDDIGDIGVALGMTGFACKLDADLSKLRWKGCIQDGFGMGALHADIFSLSSDFEACLVTANIFEILRRRLTPPLICIKQPFLRGFVTLRQVNVSFAAGLRK